MPPRPDYGSLDWPLNHVLTTLSQFLHVVDFIADGVRWGAVGLLALAGLALGVHLAGRAASVRAEGRDP